MGLTLPAPCFQPGCSLERESNAFPRDAWLQSGIIKPRNADFCWQSSTQPWALLMQLGASLAGVQCLGGCRCPRGAESSSRQPTPPDTEGTGSSGR